jgi:hypothetical protein
MEKKTTMKHIWTSLLLMAGLLTACTDSSVDDLKGVYPAPSVYELNTVTDEGVTKTEGKNIFSVELSDSEGNMLHVAFVGSKYFLESNDYTPGDTADLTVGTYIKKESYLQTSEGQSAISTGTISVTKSGDDYQFSGVVWAEDGSIAKFTSQGTLAYVRTPTKLTGVAKAKISAIENTDLFTVELVLTGSGVTSQLVNGEPVYSGSGDMASLYFVTSERDLTAGTYQPATGPLIDPQATAQAGTFYKGGLYNYDLFGTIIPLNIYSCWNSIVDGNAVFGSYIDGGSISVEKSDDNYTVTIDYGELYAQYSGPITFDGATVAPTDSYSYTDAQEEKGDYLQHTLTVTNGTGTVAQFVIFTDKNAANLSGTYTVTASPEKTGDMSGGMELMGFPLGSYFVENGKNYYLTGGSLLIIDNNGTLSLIAGDLTSVDNSGNSGTTASLTFADVSKN